MKKIGDIQNWNEGDKRDIAEKELKTLREKGLYDSYDKTYVINGFKWKIVSKLINPDSTVVYTLECVGTEEEQGQV
ncbi:MAG TPA: hypothetical protein VFF49_06760 [Thermodesulfobacteriota bacterium]|nr:hypothetical protein [Thermodesulfobacteriota bacterium]